MLRGVTLPPGFNASAITGANLASDRYQLGATVTGTVACTWFKRWAQARRTGNSAGVQQAVNAMATAKTWPILQQMSKSGAYPEDPRVARRRHAQRELAWQTTHRRRQLRPRLPSARRPTHWARSQLRRTCASDEPSTKYHALSDRLPPRKSAATVVAACRWARQPRDLPATRCCSRAEAAVSVAVTPALTKQRRRASQAARYRTALSEMVVLAVGGLSPTRWRNPGGS